MPLTSGLEERFLPGYEAPLVGELPEERRRMLPPGLGDLEMIIGG